MLNNLPPSFDEWQAAHFYGPLTVYYKEADLSYTFEKVYFASVLPEKSLVRAIVLHVKPQSPESLDSAIKLAEYYDKELSTLPIERAHSNSPHFFSIDEIPQLMEKSKLSKISYKVSRWEKGERVYSIAIGRQSNNSVSEWRIKPQDWHYEVTISVRVPGNGTRV